MVKWKCKWLGDRAEWALGVDRREVDSPCCPAAMPFWKFHGPSWREKVNKSRAEVALARHHSYFEA